MKLRRKDRLEVPHSLEGAYEEYLVAGRTSLRTRASVSDPQDH